MTSEELAAAGISSTREEVHGSENIQPQEDNPVPATVSDFENREDGEIRSEEKTVVEEDLRDVDADSRELIAARRSKSFPPSFVFGESKVTTNLIREYEAAGFFPTGDGRAPLMSRFLLLKLMKSSCFATSSLADSGSLATPLCLRF
jgi:hypothetical protein